MMESNSPMIQRIKLILIIITVIIVFMVPYGYHVDVGPGPNGLMAITWELPETYGLMILSALEYFIYYLYRLVVLRGMWRLLNGAISSRRFMVHGLVSEIIPLLISIPGVLFLSSEGENYIPIMIPIPILLLYCGFVVIYLRTQSET
ncbi:MAG: hypothetical protein KAJ36_09445 [Candidatus Thorarchaeota archaeon]|nr:hypothetical protein [Candidatus Thorarchaeota archaeon]